MRIRYFSAAALVLMFLGVANSAKAQSAIVPTEGLNPSRIIVSSVSQTTVFMFIKRWIKTNKNYEGVTMETLFVNDIGMDSLDFFNLCSAIDDEFDTNVGFTFNYSDDLSVGDLVYAVVEDLS